MPLETSADAGPEIAGLGNAESEWAALENAAAEPEIAEVEPVERGIAGPVLEQVARVPKEAQDKGTASA